MRAASIRYLNPLRLLSNNNNHNVNAYDPLPGYNERQNGNVNGNPPPYKTGRLQTMTQRYRILRSPTRLILAILVIAGIVGLIGNGGYQKHQRYPGEHRHEPGPPPPPTREEQRLEKEALEEHWQPFPRYV